LSGSGGATGGFSFGRRKTAFPITSARLGIVSWPNGEESTSSATSPVN
jgi:hypothetical protein